MYYHYSVWFISSAKILGGGMYIHVYNKGEQANFPGEANQSLGAS